MMHLFLLLVATALVSQNIGTDANVINLENSLNNNLEPNVIAPPKKPRRLKNFVHIWTPPAEQVKREPNEKTVLECSAMGNPLPSISWTRNGELIPNYEGEINEIIPSHGFGELVSKLVITTTTPGEEEYTCIATAGLKRDTATTTVFTIQSDEDEQDLLALEKMLIAKPTITYYYNDLFQDEGNIVVLPCRVHTTTKSQIFWHDSDDMFVSNNNPRMKVLPSGDLMINGLRWSDMGNFTCYASNIYGKDSIKTFLYPTKNTKRT